MNTCVKVWTVSDGEMLNAVSQLMTTQNDRNWTNVRLWTTAPPRDRSLPQMDVNNSVWFLLGSEDTQSLEKVCAELRGVLGLLLAMLNAYYGPSHWHLTTWWFYVSSSRYLNPISPRHFNIAVRRFHQLHRAVLPKCSMLLSYLRPWPPHESSDVQAAKVVGLHEMHILQNVSPRQSARVVTALMMIMNHHW